MLRKLNHKIPLAIFALLGFLALGGCGGEEEQQQEQGPPNQGEDSYDSTGGGSA